MVDGAFLRRIQMKVQVESPSLQMFSQIFVANCQSLGIPFDPEALKYLVNEWYRKPNRILQAVHPRDILKIVKALCEYEAKPIALNNTLIDEACRSYFV